MKNPQQHVSNRFKGHYQEGYFPWDIRRPDFNLIKTIKEKGINSCKVLEIGCGTGDNAIWLAQQNFQITGIDVSEIAITEARIRASKVGAKCNFITGNFFLDEIKEAPFEFVFDRGCFHSFDSDEERKAYAQKVSSLLGKEGLWLSLIGCADKPHNESGPPLRTAKDIVMAVEPYFMILSLTASYFFSNKPEPPMAWICLMQKRK